MIAPVIGRELRGLPRQAITYWSRVAGAGLLLGPIASWWVLGYGRQPPPGWALFHGLNHFFFLTMWLAGPVLTADCISRERRDGTLGLLFLTPLRARDIAAAKALIHVFRGLTLWLAALPILALPMLIGGVTSRDLVLAALDDGSAFWLGLAAGLLASAWSREWNRSLVMGLCLSLGFGLVWQQLQTTCLALSAGVPKGLWGRSVVQALASPWQTTAPFWQASGAATIRLQSSAAITVSAGLFAAAALVFLWAVLIAGRRIERHWRDQPPTPRRLWWQRIFCTPILAREILRRRMAAALTRNPIGWLQEYSWNSRLTKWGWCLVAVLVESLVAWNDFGFLGPLQGWLGTALAIGISFSAVGSFRRERQTGALELILVTPLKEREIILGRLFGLWSQFLPAVAILVCVALSAPGGLLSRAYPFLSNPASAWVPLSLLATFLAQPLVGLYFSLRCKHFLVGFALALGAGLWSPSLLTAGFVRLAWATGADPLLAGPQILSALGQLALGVLAWQCLHRVIARRSFGTLPGHQN